MPAPQGNMNAVRNGIKVRTLVVGDLHPRWRALQREALAYRRALEDATVERHGEVSVVHAHAVDTAAAATLHAAVCRWLLRKQLDKMSTQDILNCSREVLKAKETRDRAVKNLNLDRDTTNVLDALYTIQTNDLPHDTALQRPGNGPDTPEATATPPSPQSPTQPQQAAHTCDWCDGEGLVGRPCPACHKESHDGPEVA